MNRIPHSTLRIFVLLSVAIFWLGAMDLAPLGEVQPIDLLPGGGGTVSLISPKVSLTDFEPHDGSQKKRWRLGSYGRAPGGRMPTPYEKAALKAPMYLVGDFNGDGYKDMQIIIPGNEVGSSVNMPGETGKQVCAMYFGNADGTMTYVGQGLPLACASLIVDPIDNYAVSKYVIQVGDFNGDGLDDFLVQGTETDECWVVYSHISGSGANWSGEWVAMGDKPPGWTSWAGTINHQTNALAVVKDFNNDGKCDIALFNSINNSAKYQTLTFLISTGAKNFNNCPLSLEDMLGFELPGNHVNVNPDSFTYMFQDIDGDGLVDILAFESDSAGNDARIDVRLMYNKGLTTSGDAKMRFAYDLNGGDATVGQPVTNWPFNQDGYWNLSWLGSPAYRETLFGDFDGDGKIDYLHRQIYQSGWYTDNFVGISYYSGPYKRENGQFNDDITHYLQSVFRANEYSPLPWGDTYPDRFGSTVIIGKFSGHKWDEIVSWMNRPANRQMIYIRQSNATRSSWTRDVINNITTKSIDFADAVDVNGDGIDELLVVTGSAHDLMVSTYRVGKWYEDNLFKQSDKSKLPYKNNKEIESVVVEGHPVLFKYGVDPVDDSDSNLAWSSLRSDGSWLPWQAVLLDEKNADGSRRQYTLNKNPFRAIVDGSNVIIMQRSDVNDASLNIKIGDFKCIRFTVSQPILSSDGSVSDPIIRQYYDYVYSVSGTKIPDNSHGDDTLVLLVEPAWGLSVNDYFDTTKTPAGNLFVFKSAANSILTDVQKNSVLARIGAGDLTSFDATYIPGQKGKRLNVILPFRGDGAIKDGLVDISIRTSNGRPVRRGVGNDFSNLTEDERTTQIFERDGLLPSASGTLVQTLPDAVPVFLIDSNVGISGCPSVSPFWNTILNYHINIVVRDALSLKICANDQNHKTHIFHIPLDDCGIPAFYCDTAGIMKSNDAYRPSWLTDNAQWPYLVARIIPYQVVYDFNMSASISDPFIYQSVDGCLHVLAANTSTDIIQEVMYPSSYIAPDKVGALPSSRGTNEAIRFIDSKQGLINSGCPQVTLGKWNSAPGKGLQPFPLEVRCSRRPSVIECPGIISGSNGSMTGKMNRVIVGDYLATDIDGNLIGGSRSLVSVGQFMTRLNVVTRGLAIANPSLVGVIESAPPLPPEIAEMGGSYSQVSLERSSGMGYTLKHSDTTGYVNMTDIMAYFARIKVDAYVGKIIDGSSSLALSESETLSLTSSFRSRIGTSVDGTKKVQRNLGQAVFEGDKAIVADLFLPNTNPQQSAGMLVQPVVPSQKIRRVYPFGLSANYIDLGNWSNPTASSGWIINQKRLNEEIQWTTRAKITKKRCDESNGSDVDESDLQNVTQWSAYGGVRVVREQAANGYTSSVGHYSDVTSTFGATIDVSNKWFDTWSFKLFNIQELMGFTVKYSSSNSHDSSSGLSLKVDVNVNERFDSYLNNVMSAQVQNGNIIHAAHAPSSTTGPVDAFEFSTFYLGNSYENFQEFYANMINPTWITTSSGYSSVTPDDKLWVNGHQDLSSQIAIIPEAKKNLMVNFLMPKPIWRIAHRVTYISRLYSTDYNTTNSPEL